MKEKLGIGIIGCGRIGATHLEALKQLKDTVNLAAVIDTDQKLVERIAAKYDVPKYYTSAEEAFNNPGIDAVVVCLPHHLHLPVTIAAAKAGKHVLVEKAVARTCSELDKMIEAADDNKVTLMAAQSHRFFGPWWEAKRRVKEIGNIFNTLFVFMTFLDKRSAPSWWAKNEYTGGFAYTLGGSHMVDYIMWLLEDKIPESVYSEACSNNSDFEGPDDIIIVVRFKDAAIANFHISHNKYPQTRECFLLGAKGNIYLNYDYDPTGAAPCGTAKTELYINGNLVMSEKQTIRPFVQQMKEFVDSIREGREPITSGRKVRKYMQILDMAQESARRHEIVRCG